MKRVVLVITGILSGAIFAVLAGVGISILITHTYRSATYTLVVTSAALFIACLGFRSARLAAAGKLSDSKVEAPPT